jgi:hypothetical protein
MEIKGAPMRHTSAAETASVWEPLNTRLRRLRRERQLVEKAIEALREVARARQSRARRRARV